MAMVLTNFVEYDQYGLCAETEETVDLFVSIDLQKKNAVLPIQRQTVFTEVRDDQVFDSIMQQCRSIAENLNVHELVAFMILETQNWNVHRVYENWPQFHDSILKTIGIFQENVMKDPSLKHPNLPPDEFVECQICFCEYPVDEMWELQCGHAFCANCWKDHVQSFIIRGQHQIGCQMDSCRCKLPPNSVEMICGKETYNNLMRFMMDQQVSLADTLTNCPSPQCGKPVNVLTTGLCGVLKCSCGHEFCSECHEPSHAPATCAEKQQWEVVTGDEVMQQRLFGENVKKCPSCQSVIEKNGGCNHMTCYKCRHEFCWMCMKDWSSHPKNFYNCEAYRKEDDPFLKKPDNINKEFLAQYHDVYMKYEVANKAWKEKIPSMTSVIMRRLVIEQGINELENEIAIKNLLNLIYWTDENFKWAQTRMFCIRYEDVKNLPSQEQMTANIPETKEYKIFKFVLESTMKSVFEIESKLMNLQNSNIRIMFLDILKWTRKITLLRESLLKHCDPHY